MTNDGNGLAYCAGATFVQSYNHGIDRKEANVHENVKPNVRQGNVPMYQCKAGQAGNIVIPHRDSGHLSNGEMTDIAESEF